jgi:LIVCS family branched-chain amino acid:cation transporter
MHASIKTYLPIGLLEFSFLVAILVFFLTYKPHRIIHLLGVILTPVLLATLALLVFMGWLHSSPMEAAPHDISGFGMGLKLGYQTTDLIGALLFATVILPHLSSRNGDPKQVKRQMISASLIASALLMAAYIGLCWTASRHALHFGDVAPEELLQRVSIQVLGPYGAIVSSSAAFLACLTTAISLANVFAQYLREDLLKEKLSHEVSLAITLAFTGAIANLGFSGIVKIWGPILDALYPALILLCLVNIAWRRRVVAV